MSQCKRRRLGLSRRDELRYGDQLKRGVVALARGYEQPQITSYGLHHLLRRCARSVCRHERGSEFLLGR